jgi:hypothetical protein
MTKQYQVRLSASERRELARRLRRDEPSGFTQRRIRILLHADTGVQGPYQTDRAIAEAVAVTPQTVARVRAQFVREGLEAVLERHPRPPVEAWRLDAAGEARLVALACSAPPAGHARWSLRLLSRTLVELEIVPSISPETVRKALKKTA